MAAILKDVAAQALQLTVQERGELIERLIISLDEPAEDTPAAIAQAWDEEIARRVADMDAGKTTWIAADDVMRRIRERISTAKAARAD